MKITEAREKYLAAYQEKKTGKSSVWQQTSVTREFLEFMKARQVTELERLTPGTVEEYRKRLLERVVPMTGKPLAPKTAGARLLIVRTFLAYVVEQGWLKENPAKMILGGLSLWGDGVGQGLTAEEMEKVLSHPDVQEFDGLRDRAILEVMYAAGLRSGEVAALELEDLDLKAGRLRVRPFEDGRERMAPLADGAREYLARYLKEVRPAWAQLPGEGQGERRGTALFIEPMRGNPVNKSGVERIVADAVRQVKPKVSMPCRAVRAACIARLRAKGATVEAINAQLGEAEESGEAEGMKHK